MPPDVVTIVGAIGGVSFLLASLILGVRLMWVAWRTRGIVEFVLGSGLFLMGGVSYAFTTAAFAIPSLSDGTREAFLLLHIVCNTVGMYGVGWFTRRVFRPRERWAAVAVAAIAAGYVVPAAAQVAGPGLLAYFDDPWGPWRWNQVTAILATGWCGWEALRYHALLRRRLKLGLVEAIVVDRLRLWGGSMFLASSITTISVILELFGIPMIGTAAGALVIGPLGMGIAIALWLAFFPPRFYLRRFQEAATPAA